MVRTESYAVLLRGINVGRARRLAMSGLRTLLPTTVETPSGATGPIPSLRAVDSPSRRSVSTGDMASAGVHTPRTSRAAARLYLALVVVWAAMGGRGVYDMAIASHGSQIRALLGATLLAGLGALTLGAFAFAAGPCDQLAARPARWTSP